MVMGLMASRDLGISRSWPLYIWDPLSRKRLEIETCLQWITYRKWLLGDQMFMTDDVTWPWNVKVVTLKRFEAVFSNNTPEWIFCTRVHCERVCIFNHCQYVQKHIVVMIWHLSVMWCHWSFDLPKGHFYGTRYLSHSRDLCYIERSIFNTDTGTLLVKRDTNFIAGWHCYCLGSHDVIGHVIIVSQWIVSGKWSIDTDSVSRAVLRVLSSKH